MGREFVIWTKDENGWETDGAKLSEQEAGRIAKEIREYGGVQAKALPVGIMPAAA